VVQRLLRCLAARDELLQLWAARRLQAQARGLAARQRLAAQLAGAIEIQRVVRGFLARKMVTKVRSAIEIQRVVRGFLARKKVTEARSATEIQRIARGCLARWVFADIKEEITAATKIQVRYLLAGRAVLLPRLSFIKPGLFHRQPGVVTCSAR